MRGTPLHAAAPATPTDSHSSKSRPVSDSSISSGFKTTGFSFIVDFGFSFNVRFGFSFRQPAQPLTAGALHCPLHDLGRPPADRLCQQRQQLSPLSPQGSCMTKPRPTKRTCTSRRKPTGQPDLLREVFCAVGAERRFRVTSNAWLRRTWRVMRRPSPLATLDVAAYGACAIHLCEVSCSIVSRLPNPPVATADDHRCLPATQQAGDRKQLRSNRRETETLI